VLPSREEIEELLTEPTEVTRWGVALAAVAAVAVAVLLEAALP
jgi:hypothetical protein